MAVPRSAYTFQHCSIFSGGKLLVNLLFLLPD